MRTRNGCLAVDNALSTRSRSAQLLSHVALTEAVPAVGDCVSAVRFDGRLQPVALALVLRFEVRDKLFRRIVTVTSRKRFVELPEIHDPRSFLHYIEIGSDSSL